MTTLKTCLYFLPLLLLSCYNNKLLYERIQEIEKRMDVVERELNPELPKYYWRWEPYWDYEAEQVIIWPESLTVDVDSVIIELEVDTTGFYRR